MSQFAGRIGLPVTGISQRVPGMGQGSGEGLGLEGLLLAPGSPDPAQTNPSAEVTEQFPSAGAGAGLWRAEKSSTNIRYYS